MNVPKFTAASALGRTRKVYRGQPRYGRDGNSLSIQNIFTAPNEEVGMTDAFLEGAPDEPMVPAPDDEAGDDLGMESELLDDFEEDPVSHASEEVAMAPEQDADVFEFEEQFEADDGDSESLDDSSLPEGG